MLYFWKALGTRTTVALLPDVTHTNTGRQRQIQERKQRNFEIGQVCPYTLDGASWISSGPSIGHYCPYTLKLYGGDVVTHLARESILTDSCQVIVLQHQLYNATVLIHSYYDHR